jgi:FlaG/FlaF family flagellin (archaellin)
MKSKGKDKGVSELVGYIITFGIVIAMVTVIYTSGMPMVEQTSETAALQSMKTSFVSLQSNVKKVALDQSPVRTMKFNLIKGSIGAKKSPEAGWLNVTINGNPHKNLSFGNIEYTTGSKKVIYENGAVIESTPGGNITVSDPPIYFTNYSADNAAHVIISVINVSGNFSAGGGIAEMHLSSNRNDTHLYNASDPVSFVNISINSSYAYAWSLFLSNSYKETFKKDPTGVTGYSDHSCWLNVSKGPGGVADKLNLTLIAHNVSI